MANIKIMPIAAQAEIGFQSFPVMIDNFTKNKNVLVLMTKGNCFGGLESSQKLKAMKIG